MVDPIEMVGYAAGGIVAISLMPQVVKSWRTKSTQDISLCWNSIYLTGLVLWIIYGFGIESWPLVSMVSFEVCMAFSLLYLKLRHG